MTYPNYITEYDLYLLGEGTHWQSYDKLGAHLREVDGVKGVNFAVWAPNANRVRVIGSFNGWRGEKHELKKLIPQGIWEIFIPGVKVGDLYKFQITHGSDTFEKADPYGFGAEIPPRTASKVVDLAKHEWKDQKWIQSRSLFNSLDAPISIYEVHLGSWMRDPKEPQRWLSYRELGPKLVDYVQRLGYTHLELLPIHEHPLTASWGYQPVGYFAVTSRYGDPEDFMWFVDYCHQRGIGIILDWVPAHFPRDAHGLRMFDGTHLYEHSDPRQGEHRDWGTLIFNFGRWEVRNFLVSNALFWIDKYHIDGLRVDAVASMIYLDYSREEGEWIPNEYGGRENLQALDFIRTFNTQVHSQFPNTLTIAEESTAFGGVSRPVHLGGLGFSMKWNMGWMNDTLRYIEQNPVHRKYHHNHLTFSLIYAFTENFVLPFSHDEVVHGKRSMLDKMPGDLWQKFANLRALYGYMWCHPGKKLLFMGCDFGQWAEWDYDESLQWHLTHWESHSGMQKYLSDLNRMYREEPSLHQLDFDSDGFEWIDCHNSDESCLSFMRKAKDPDDFVVVSINFTPVPRMEFRIGVPKKGYYREISNSDSSYYSGSNLGNGNGVMAEEIEFHGRPYSIKIVMPPLATVVFKPVR
ncbi:1,4-alpha-glucan branching protein GlgB [Planctomycetales bacterium 10988]|nr:1,4-alpha-glucan branching protein GlgB [Planctomycetales bacterium 10988]